MNIKKQFNQRDKIEEEIWNHFDLEFDEEALYDRFVEPPEDLLNFTNEFWDYNEKEQKFCIGGEGGEYEECPDQYYNYQEIIEKNGYTMIVFFCDSLTITVAAILDNKKLVEWPETEW